MIDCRKNCTNYECTNASRSYTRQARVKKYTKKSAPKKGDLVRTNTYYTRIFQESHCGEVIDVQYGPSGNIVVYFEIVPGEHKGIDAEYLDIVIRTCSRKTIFTMTILKWRLSICK